MQDNEALRSLRDETKELMRDHKEDTKELAWF